MEVAHQEVDCQRQQHHYTQGNGEITAHNGQNGVLDIAKVVVYRTHGVGECTGLKGVFPEGFVNFVKFVLTGFLPAEHLYHPLTGNHFLHVAVDRAQGALLADEELARLARQGLGDENHAQHGDHGDDGEDPGFRKHGDKDDHQSDHSGKSLGDGHGDHLPQSVDVAGVTGHDVACGVGVVWRNTRRV